jgi:hypothetical protein
MIISFLIPVVVVVMYQTFNYFAEVVIEVNQMTVIVKYTIKKLELIVMPVREELKVLEIPIVEVLNLLVVRYNVQELLKKARDAKK